jgi:hypothetical protein
MFNQQMGQYHSIKCTVHAFHVQWKPLFCNRHLTFMNEIFKYQLHPVTAWDILAYPGHLNLLPSKHRDQQMAC